MATCPKCDGDKFCKNEYHGIASATNPFDWDNKCPACGKPATSPGKCSRCGGTGEVDDDSDEQEDEY